MAAYYNSETYRTEKAMVTKKEEWDAIIAQADEKACRDRPVDEALYWTEATIIQCQRVIAIHDWLKGRPDDWTRHTTARLEALSLLNAAGKVMRWIDEAEPDPKWDRTLISDFNNLLVDVRTIRNKREHDDEYGPGKTKEPLKDATAEGSNLKLMVGANVTVLRGEKILLGGIVDVHELRDMAIKAANEFRRLQHEQAPAEHFKKKPGMIGPIDT